MSLPQYIIPHKDGFIIHIYVQPRASRSRLVGEHNGALKAAITAPPVDGAANSAVIELLSDQLDLAKKNIHLKSGHTSRNKSFLLIGVSESQLLESLKHAL